jgi:hypothetical protein
MVGDIQGLADPNADRLLFWDDSVGAVGPLTVSTGLTLSGTTLTVNNSELSITESQITDLQSYLLPADIGSTVQGYDSATAKTDEAANFTAGLQSSGVTVATLGANTLTGDQTITKAAPSVIINASSGDGSIYFQDNSIVNRSSLFWNRTGDTTYLQQLDTDGSTVRSRIALSETGDVNIDYGTLKYAGAEVVSTSNTLTLTNKTLTSPVLNTSVSGTAILDEDNMASNSATQLATQQSIKAYVDANVASGPAFRAYLSANETGPDANPTIMSTADFTNWTEDFDTDSDYNPATGRFTPQTAGYYQINATVMASSLSSRFQVDIQKNGTVVAGTVADYTASGSNTGCAASVNIYMNGSTDYLEMVVQSPGDSSWTAIANRTQFSGHHARAA